MKVEFKDSVFGYSLYIDISQFLLAQDSDEEMSSLWDAVSAYYSTLCFGFDVKKVYDIICDQIGKRGKIIFTYGCKDNIKYAEIYAVCNNNPKLIYTDE